LLPVWIMAYRYKDQVHRFLMNGQTGKSTGTAPISYHKIAAVVGIVLAVILVGLVCMGIIAAIAGSH
ncbi:MAG TPA: zinc ribbon domain-containing protein, partial [Pirellulaceae bacterium]|nr:zinc ribbon domain-containing protein [Pirellulaceae bacterium]